MRLHAIIVSADFDEIEAAHKEACAIFEAPHVDGTTFGGIVSSLTDEAVNGYRSFLVAPDGSKEGWPTSKLFDERRDEFVEWMRSNEALCLDWVEVQFGDDDGKTLIVRHSDDYLDAQA